MAEKILQTRLHLKYDSLTNWLASDLILKSGEAAIAYIPAEANADGVVAPPATLIKIGTGDKKFSELPWLQAVSSDIYAWAKASTKPTYKASEIEELSTFISGQIQDTNTIFQLSKVDDYTYKLQSQAKGSTTWSDVSTLTIPNKTADIEALQNLVGETSVASQISSAVGNLKMTKVSAGEGKIISEISQANGIVSATTRDLVAADIPTIAQSQVDGLETALAGKQATVSFDGTYDTTSNKAATVATVTNAIGDLNKTDTAVAKKLVSAVSEANGIITVTRRELVAEDIPTIEQSQVSGLDTALSAKQDVLGFQGEYNKTSNPVTTKSYVDSVIAGLNGAMHFEGKVEGNTFTEAVAGKTYSAGDVVLYGYDEYVYDGNEWHILGNENIYQLKTDAESQHTALKNELTTEINKKQNTLTFDGTYNANSNPAATKKTVTDAIGALDKADTAVAGKVVSAVSESDGIITVSRRELVANDIPELAQSKITGLETALAGKQGTLSFDGTYNASSNKVATKKTVTDAIAALDKTDAAVTKQFVTSVSETDGIITVTRAQPAASDISGLAAIATSGNVKDLAQSTGDVLVLNCGSSTVNV